MKKFFSPVLWLVLLLSPSVIFCLAAAENETISLKDPSQFIRAGLDLYWTNCQCGEISDSDDKAPEHDRVDHVDRRPWMAVVAIKDKRMKKKESLLQTLTQAVRVICIHANKFLQVLQLGRERKRERERGREVFLRPNGE